jgi:hypothetical protein
MEKLAIHLVLHGALVLIVSLFGGLLLYRVLLKDENPAAWHLVHAGGTVRGVLLIALAAIIPMLALPLSQVSFFVWLIIISIWASMFAMMIAAVSGERGLRLSGSSANKLVYLFYAIHIITIFPAFFLLIYGLLKAL